MTGMHSMPPGPGSIWAMEEKQVGNVQKQKLICGKSFHLSGGKCILEVCVAVSKKYCAVFLNCVT